MNHHCFNLYVTHDDALSYQSDASSPSFSAHLIDDLNGLSLLMHSSRVWLMPSLIIALQIFVYLQTLQQGQTSLKLLEMAHLVLPL
jgi:hypothetical protein